MSPDKTFSQNLNLFPKYIQSKLVYLLFFFFVFFPYLQILPLPTDTQPYALVVSFFVFILLKKKFTRAEIMLLTLSLTSFFLFLIDGVSFNSLRSFLNYLSLFLISFAAFRVLRSELINFELLLKFVSLTWFIVAAIQTFYSREFLTFLISSSRTTENRGVTGLAPEPTFLGIVFIFFILMFTHSQTKNKNLYIAMCVFAIIFFAKSSMAVLFLVLMIFVWFVTSLNSRALIVIILCGLFTPQFIEIMKDSRLGYILDKLLEDPMSVLLLDASINDRFFHVFFSLKGFFDNLMIPNGYGSWGPYSSEQISIYSNYVIVEWFSSSGRIMSGFGSSFFELGIFALVIPLVIFWHLYRIYNDNISTLLFYFIFINAIMFSAIMVGFPLFCFYLGYLQYLAWRKNQCLILM